MLSKWPALKWSPETFRVRQRPVAPATAVVAGGGLSEATATHGRGGEEGRGGATVGRVFCRVLQSARLGLDRTTLPAFPGKVCVNTVPQPCQSLCRGTPYQIKMPSCKDAKKKGTPTAATTKAATASLMLTMRFKAFRLQHIGAMRRTREWRNCS